MATVTLTPNGTFKAASSFVGPFISSWECVDDDDNASYVNNVSDGSGNNNAIFDLTSYTLGTAVTKQFRCTVRGNLASNTTPLADSLIGNASQVVYVRDSDGAFGSISGTATNAGTSITTATSSWGTGRLSQTEVDSMKVTASSSASSTSGSITSRAYWIEVEMVYVAQPTVVLDAVAPDPYTASTSIPMSWTPTFDADGGAQTRYRLYVTDDNDGDAVVYESGEVLGAAVSANAGPLGNGNYTAHLAVAQTVNGVAHWSDYATDSFEVDVVTSDVDAVTASAVDADGKIVVTVDRDAATEPWEFVEVQRSSDSGVTWADVRFATFVDATGDADEFVTEDHESPNGTSVVYRARATYYSVGLPITGPWTSSSSVSWSSSAEWLKSVSDPSLNVTIKGAQFGTQSRSKSAAVFDVVGTSAPVVVADIMSTPAGSISISVEGVDALRSLLQLLEAETVFVLNLLPESLTGTSLDGFQYIAVLNVGEDWRTQYYFGDVDSELRTVTLPYVSVTSPPDSTAGSA